MALTSLNHYEIDLAKSVKSRFRQFIYSDLFNFSTERKKEYIEKLDKIINKDNVKKISNYPNKAIKLHLDGKVTLF